MSISQILLKENLLSLAQEVKELGIGTSIPEVDIQSISPLSFYRSYVSASQPVLIRNTCRHWPALERWSKEYLCTTLKEKHIDVAVTPNGYADSIAYDEYRQRNFFVLPEERKMTMSFLLEALDHPDLFPGVFYLQQQNSNLTKELPELLGDVDEEIGWATEAFGQNPDAVNIWIGDSRAITSMHKDPYENIYCVVKGYKDFILLPPTDLPWIPHQHCPVATYIEQSPGNFEIVPQLSMEPLMHSEEGKEVSEVNNVNEGKESRTVPWICVDPLAPDFEKYPLYKHASPLHVRVQAGDALYLPSLWFHHVRQSQGCIAVNYWYDMQYDMKYAYFKFLESVSH